MNRSHRAPECKLRKNEKFIFRMCVSNVGGEQSTNKQRNIVNKSNANDDTAHQTKNENRIFSNFRLRYRFQHTRHVTPCHASSMYAARLQCFEQTRFQTEIKFLFEWLVISLFCTSDASESDAIGPYGSRLSTLYFSFIAAVAAIIITHISIVKW